MNRSFASLTGLALTWLTLVACGDAAPSPAAAPDGGSDAAATIDASPDGSKPALDGASPDCPPVDDGPCVLHGSGFGTNAIADQMWTGGKTGTIESATLGHDVSTDPRWTTDTPGSGVTKITNVKAYSYGKAMMADSATAPKGPSNTGPWQGIFSVAYDTGSHFPRITLHYKVLWEDQSTTLGQTPLAQMQWKMVRLGFSPGVSDANVPNMLLSNWIGQATLGRQSGDHGTSWLDQGGMPRIAGGWYAVEMEVVVNAPLSASNGSFHVRVRRLSDGVVTLDVSAKSVQYIAPNDPNGFFQWIVFQNYQGNLNQGTNQAEPTTNPSRVFLDDVYTVSGGSGAYVVLGDAPTWSAVKHEEVQPFSTWSDGEIRIPKLNQGGFADLSGKYFYVKTGPSTVTREAGYPL